MPFLFTYVKFKQLLSNFIHLNCLYGMVYTVLSTAVAKCKTQLPRKKTNLDFTSFTLEKEIFI